MPEPVIPSWSGGKDSVLALAALRDSGSYDPVVLLTSLTSGDRRISVHGVRRPLLHAQARALGLPLCEMWLEPHSSNTAYEAALAAALAAVRRRYPAAQRVAFGDLFLEDIRRYREQCLAGLDYEGLFPLWGRETAALARSFVAHGYEARLVCVDTDVLPATFAGRLYDAELLADLPPGVDPCGERGEFHTFVSTGPGFAAPLRYELGAVVVRDGRFASCDLIPAAAERGGPVVATAHNE